MACCPCYESSSRARLALLVCNIILVVSGLGCLAAGVVLSMGQDAYGDSLDWMRNTVVKNAEAAGITDLDASALDVKFVTGPVSSAFLVTGSVVLVLAVLGIVASCGRFQTVLYVYVGVNSLVMVGITITVVTAYADSGSFEKPTKRLLKESLVDFTGIAGTDATTLGWNAIMMHFNCCGVDSFEDFSESPDWVREVNGISLVTPIACCLEEEIKNPPKCGKLNKYEKKTFYDRGCYEPLFHFVATQSGALMFTMYFLLFMEFICLFLSVLITCVMVSKSPDTMRVMDFMY
ncbi:tetraspanin [Elysia marginata]|uniref:Tetraspanin n=1 Tax=Elysia marginata TaxID=1093978 RepID=A0AAV4HBD3_9GAST|nr:tetraspanin [Elysia marginata]